MVGCRCRIDAVNARSFAAGGEDVVEGVLEIVERSGGWGAGICTDSSLVKLEIGFENGEEFLTFESQWIEQRSGAFIGDGGNDWGEWVRYFGHGCRAYRCGFWGWFGCIAQGDAFFEDGIDLGDGGSVGIAAG